MKNKNKYIILSTMLIQLTVILIFNLTILTSNSIIAVKRSIPFFDVVVSIITIFMFISIKKLSYYEKKEAEFELMKANMENTEELISLLHTQRHEYLTHIQTIGAMLYLGEYEELSNYLRGISEEYKFTHETVDFGHPALTALINAKREMAWKKGIFFYINCKKEIDSIEVDPWGLCSLISNVIDNAIEAVSMQEGKKWIKIVVDYSNGNFIFEIENRGYIEKDIMKILFQPGSTSKVSIGRGYGLHIAKEIVDKYRGSIEVKNTDNGTVLAVIELPREGFSNDEKIS